MTNKWLERGLILLILWVAVGARLHKIDDQSLWHDEGNSLRLAERSTDDLLDATSRDIHPPGYYLLLKGWIEVGGTSELSLRVLSVWWGVLAVAGTFALAKRLDHPIAGLVAAAWIALHPFAVYYSQETRMYAQLAALSVLSLWVFANLLYHSERLRGRERFSPMAEWAVALALINAFGLYTQYTFPFTIAVELIIFAVWWLQDRTAPALTRFVSLNILTWLLFQPWAFTAYEQVTTWPSAGDTSTLDDRLERITTTLFYGQPVAHLTPLLLIVPLILIGAAFFGKKRSYIIPLLLIALSVGGLLLSGSYREANLKFLLPAQIMVGTLLGIGARRLAMVRQPVGQIGAILLVMGMLGWHFQHLNTLYNNSEFARDNYRAIAQTINQSARPTDAIILDAPNQAEVFSYYYRGEVPVYGLPRGLGGDDAATQAETLAVIQNHRRIYLVLWGERERDPNGVVQATLNQNAFFLSHQWVNNLQFIQYAVLGDKPTTPDTPTQIDYGTLLRLNGYALSGREFGQGAGDVLGVTLFWEFLEPLPKAYKVSVQLLYPDGRLAAQGQDTVLPTTIGTSQDRQAILLAPELPVGEYTLVVSVYDPDAPLTRLAPSENAGADNTLILESVRVQ